MMSDTKTGKIKVRVVRQVEGKKIGDEFECYPHEYTRQIKHKSIEIIGDAEGGGEGNKALSVDQLKAKLKELNVDVPKGSKKDDLIKLLDEAEASAKAAKDLEELKAKLTEKGVAFEDDATAEDLQKLLDEAGE
jgi:hypothetical protein